MLALRSPSKSGSIFNPDTRIANPRSIRSPGQWTATSKGSTSPMQTCWSTTPTPPAAWRMMVVRSSQPKLFVIPNNRDFQRILADPIAFHTRYLLVPDPATNEPGQLNQTYPSLWRTGAGFTKMVHQFRAQSACPDYRLFHVLGHSNLLT